MEERTTFVVGEVATRTKLISKEGIERFAQLTGDTNPIHVDAAYADKTHFQGPIAHGMMVASLVSAVLGIQLPGPGSIYLKQDLRFLNPVRPGDEITVQVEVTSWDSERGRIKLQTDVTNQEGTIVITGEARMVMASYLK